MSVRVAYALALAVGALVSLALGLWAYRREDAEARSAFLVYIAANVLWAVCVAVGLYVENPVGSELVLYANDLLGLTTVFLFTRFAFAFTGHDTSLSDPMSGAVSASYAAMAVVIATNPLHGRHWSATRFRSDPFPYTEAVDGTLAAVPDLWSFLVLGVALYYFVELFVKSRHRSSLSVVLLIVGVFGAVVPVLLSQFGLTGAEGFNHAPLGIPLFVAPASYAVFGLGMMDVPPVARDTLMDQLRDPVLVLDAEGVLLDYNAASESLASVFATSDPVGRDAATLLPAVFNEITLPDDPEQTPTQSVTLTDGGSYAHYSVLVSPVAEEDSVVAYAMLLRDVTELESYRRELEQTNERLDRFASVVSHDLRNPLTVANGYTGSLREDLGRADVRGDPGAETMLDTVSEIETSHERMRTIVADLRTLTDSGEPVDDPDPLSVSRAAQAAWENVDTGAADLAVEGTGRIYADRGRLLSAFENLFRNAVEHGSDDVSVTVGLTDDGFYVADDGPGVPPADRESVFEYGYTTSDAGTGLGLSIVDMMAESHGWTVSLTVSADGGARFEFEGAIVDRGDRSSPGPRGVPGVGL